MIRQVLRLIKILAGIPGTIVRSPKRFLLGIERLSTDLRAESSASGAARVPAAVSQFRLPEMVDPLRVTLDLSLDARPHVNVLLPVMGLANMSGGPNTVIQIGCQIAAGGTPVRLIGINGPVDRDPEPLWKHVVSLTNSDRRPDNVEITDTWTHGALRVGRNDVYVASAWWTAQSLSRTWPRIPRRPFLYVIQDYEPNIYPLSLHYALAMETYSMDFRAIINSSLLAEYMTRLRVGHFDDPKFVEQCAVFDPPVDRHKFFPEKTATGTRRLIMYARPYTGVRNIFDIGLLALNKAAMAGAFSQEPWEMYFVGDNVTPVKLDSGHVIQQLPWTDHETNSRMLRQADLVLSLILSPHPSYVPLEAAACGAIVVTNTFFNKTRERLEAISPNFVAADPTIASVAKALAQAADRVAQGEVELANPINSSRTWADVLGEIMPRVNQFVRDCRQAL